MFQVYTKLFLKCKGEEERGKGGTKCSNWDTVEIIWDGDGERSKYKNFRKAWKWLSKNSVG